MIISPDWWKRNGRSSRMFLISRRCNVAKAARRLANRNRKWSRNQARNCMPERAGRVVLPGAVGVSTGVCRICFNPFSRCDRDHRRPAQPASRREAVAAPAGFCRFPLARIT
jgi:hypothetical protein